MKRKIVSILIILGLLVGLTAIPAQAATEEEIEESIVAGLAWLVKQQDLDDGSWGMIEKVARTAFAVVKLEDRAFELGYESPFVEEYKYSENVIAGLDYIFSQAAAPGIGGICFAAGWHETYNTGIAMMAIAASREPNRVVSVGNPVVDGKTYIQVLQANVNYFAAAQNADGGWRYWATPVLSDNSNTGYAALGLRYAEDFGCTIPQSLKNNLSIFIDTIQDDVDGDTNDSGSWYALDYPDPDDPIPWVNLLKTGNLLFEMAFVGDTMGVQRVTDALDYIERHWDDTGSDSIYDTGWNNPAHYQAMYCTMKGLEAFGLDTIDSIDWYDDFATVLLAQQDDNGSWPPGHWGDTVLNTEWALLTLQKVAPPPPAIIEIIEVPVDIKPQSCPNPLNLKSKGVLPVAILGTEQFDVTQVDVATVLLEGESPLRSAMEDVATPFEPFTGKEACDDCTTEGADGYLDLTFKFDKQAIVAALGEVEDGECKVLHLTGNLKDESGGTAIVGEDVVRILKKSKGKNK